MTRTIMAAVLALLVLSGCAEVLEQFPTWQERTTTSSQGVLTIYDAEQNLLSREPIPASYPFTVVMRQGVYDGGSGIFAKFQNTIRFLTWDDLTTHPLGVRLHSDSFAKKGELGLRIVKDGCGGRPEVAFRIRERVSPASMRYRSLGDWTGTGLHLPADHHTSIDDRWPDTACETAEPPIARILFDLGSADLTPLTRVAVRAAAVEIKGLDAKAVRLAGLTDATGSPEANRRLALRRADTVAAALSNAGATAAMHTEAGHGQAHLGRTGNGASDASSRAVVILAGRR